MKKISLLVLSRSSDLICTTLIQAFKENAEIGEVQHITNFDMAARIATNYELAIIFPDFPISSLSIKVNKLSDKGIKILLILSLENKYSIRYFKNLSIHGLISTQSSYDDLINAIKTLTVKNLKYISPQLISSLNDVIGDNLFASLSKKEIDVVEMAISGKKCRDIADMLKISPKTVSTYKARIYKKLDVNNDVELLKLAMTQNMNGVE